MASGFYTWSSTPSSNATADASVNWAEGQAPSSINDSARAMMARLAEYRDDTAGYTMVTAGTATAYTVSSHQVFNNTTNMTGREISIVPHTTNGDNATLNVDGLGAFPIYMSATSTLPPPAGTLVSGTIYSLMFNTTHWLLKDLFGNPYNVPIGGLIPYICPTVPNSSFVFPTAQAISRATYSALYALIGTTYGSGDGSTTFTLPDLRGRVLAGKDDMNGTAANRLTSSYFGTSAAVLGAAGGGESQQLTVAQMPSHFHTGGISDPGHSHTYNQGAAGPQKPNSGGTAPFDSFTTASTGASATGIRLNSGNGLDTVNTTGGDNPHPIVQPTIICNYILRVI